MENGSRTKNSQSEDTISKADLLTKVNRLEREMTSLKEKCRNGVYAYEVKHSLQDFEKNLAQYLYPRNRIIGTTEIYPRLMNWLELRRNTPQGNMARNKWEQVCREIEWSRNHEDVLTKLRNLNPDLTAPIETWNPVSFTSKEKMYAADLTRLSHILTDRIEREENEREAIEAL